ncbi:putative lipopolysaccharide biosynthesis glycosyltransferase wbbL [Corynebacterium renale]|uniref:glycosyltransferase family 2 protein n=1 Tax=Corynebacterium renale TaxID=1724 RepID=UPI000DA3738D|nr:glycosyltransferase family 2 protein [Corynebacterium renale]SQG64166.1 putative lipopolysaccharide biosynthesis glycosyltransferase wbbL [Corynebacterium renale]STC94480.1 putative lipopolysaccharide biosynthesis glycosyltransferase wbbL [Corynebacterium renale]
MNSHAPKKATESSGPALGVVTVTFSPGEHLGKLVDSLPTATNRDVQLILADNGSTDGSPEEQARKHPDWVTFFPTGGNIGYGAAMNAGAAQLRGEVASDYLLLVNPDVVFHEGAIDAMIRCAEAHPRAGVVGPKIIDIDGSIYPSARAIPTLRNGIGHALLSSVWPDNPWTRAYKDGERMDSEREAGWLSGSCMLVRWDAFEEVGGFDERYFMYLEDVDLCDRLGRAGWSSVWCPDAVIEHARGHVASTHTAITVPAHHDSAYRFLADRLPAWWQAPVRWVLKVGLKVRSALIQRNAH